MKKKIVAFIIVLLIVALGVSIMVLGKSKELRQEYTREKQQIAEYINANSNMGLEFMSDLGQGTATSEQPKLVYTDDGLVQGYGRNYPTDEDNILLTEVDILNPSNYNILGIHVGDSLEAAEELLETAGFKLDKNEPFRDQTMYIYKKNSAYINFKTDDTNLVVSVSVVML